MATRGAQFIQLRPLDDAAVAAVARDFLRAEPGPTLRDLLSRTGGNPLFVTELLGGLAHDQAFRIVDETAELAEAALPPPLKLTILRQLAGLPAECLQTVRIAAVLGSTFAADDLATALHSSVAELLTSLSDATAAGVLAEKGGDLAFRHDLVREAIYGDLSPSVRKALHREVGRALAAAGAPSTRVATHLALGASPGDAEAIGWLRRAAREAAPRAAAIAVELLERAVAIAGPDADDVLVELSQAMVWAGRPSEGAALIRDLLPRLQDVALEMELRSCLATSLLFHNHPDESAAEFEAAAQLAGVGPADRARLMAEASVGRMHAGDVEGAVATAREVLALGRRTGDDLLIVLACTTLAWAGVFTSDATGGLQMAKIAIEASRRSSNPAARRPDAPIVAAIIRIGADEPEEARALLRSARADAERLGLVWDLPIFHQCLGLASFATGEWVDARIEIDTAIALADEVETTWGLGGSFARLAVIATHQDDLVRARAAIESAERVSAAVPPGGTSVPWILEARALLHERDGRSAEALAELQTLWPLLASSNRLALHRTVGPMLTRLLMEAGAHDEALRVAHDLAEAAIDGTPSLRAAARHCVGLASEDADELVAAVELCRTSPRRVELANISFDAANALAQRDRREEAITLLQEARELFGQADAAWDVARVDSALRGLGVRRGGRGHRDRPRHGWDALSDTERRVATLIAEGCSNPEIAARLFISRRTVETHVSHSLAKLGLGSRVELAGEVIRRAK